MTKDEIRKRVNEIRKYSADGEGAHSKEDRLYRDFVRYVSEHGDENMRELANLVLETIDIDFCRWCG